MIVCVLDSLLRIPTNSYLYQNIFSDNNSWVSKLRNLSLVSLYTEVQQAHDNCVGMDIIPIKVTVKYLGVYLDQDLGWISHIENLAARAKKRIRYIYIHLG